MDKTSPRIRQSATGSERENERQEGKEKREKRERRDEIERKENLEADRRPKTQAVAGGGEERVPGTRGWSRCAESAMETDNGLQPTERTVRRQNVLVIPLTSPIQFIHSVVSFFIFWGVYEPWAQSCMTFFAHKHASGQELLDWLNA